MTHTVTSPASDIDSIPGIPGNGSGGAGPSSGQQEPAGGASSLPQMQPQNQNAQPTDEKARSSGPANTTSVHNAATDPSASDARNDNYAAMFSSLGSTPAETRPGAHDKSDSVATVTPANNSAQGPKQAGEPATAPLPVGANGTSNAVAGHENAPKSPLATRAETAENQLDPKSLAKITKAEAKDAKKEIKVLNSEAKTQSKLLASASSDLSKQQKAKKSAVSDETKALKAHSKAVKVEHKLHSRLLNAKAKYEKAAADVKAKEELLESSRQHSQNANGMLSSKLSKVDDLKKQKSVDDREREVKLNQLQGTIRQKKAH